jgi:uncharacterized protein YqgV (UPF0045/DUF77 family)
MHYDRSPRPLNRPRIIGLIVRSARAPFILLLSIVAAAVTAQPAPLVCASAPAGRPCEAFHFHVQAYRAETKQFVELTGLNQYATQAACDRARELYATTNTRAVEYLRGVKEKYEADRVGACHCDMTTDRASLSYVAESQRVTQLRILEEARLRLRERLLDSKQTSDSELVRALWNEPPVTPQLGAPKLATLPQSRPSVVLTAPEELKATRSIETAKSVVAAMDLPLIDIGAPAPEPPPEAIAEVAVPSGATGSQPVVPVEEVTVEAPVETEPAPLETAIESTVPEDDLASAQETAERFVEYEKERIQNVLRASSAIDDEEIKSKIFEAAMQRIQLLSNLRLLIEGSGMRSRLAAAARDAVEERDRLALIGRLFGNDVKPHWAPANADDVVLEIDRAIADEPERVLRDSTASAADKKHALYLVLAKTQPTEDQLLWLASIVEGFLR